MGFDFTANIKSGIFWIGLFKGLGQFFIWISTIIIARFLMPEDYGLVGMVTLITSFILLIGDFGFGTSVVQKKDLKDAHIHSLFWLSFIIGTIFSIILILLAPFASLFFKRTGVTPLLRMSSVALFFFVLSDIPGKLLLKNLNYKAVGLVSFISGLAASACVLLLAVLGFGAFSLVWGNIVLGFLRFFLPCVLGRWHPKLIFQRQGLGVFFSFGGAIVADRLLWYLYSNSDYMILAKKLGERIFGFYSYAFNFACIPISKIQPVLHPVLYSSFSEIQSDIPQVQYQFLKVIRLTFTLFCAVYCGMFWVIHDFVILVLGEKWTPMITTLQILLVIQPLRSIGALTPSLLHALGKPGTGVINMIIFVVIMIPSFYIGSFRGMEGVATAWVVSYPFAFFITYYVSYQVTKIPLTRYLKQLYTGLAITLLMSVSVCLFHYLISFASDYAFFLWIRFLSTIIIGALVTFSGLWFIDKNAVNMLLNIMKRKKL